MLNLFFQKSDFPGEHAITFDITSPMIKSQVIIGEN